LSRPTWRKLIVLLVCCGAVVAGLALAVGPASAENHLYRVTLLGGQTTVVTAPAGQLPSFGIDLGPVPTPTVPQPTVPRLPGSPPPPSSTPSPPSSKPAPAKPQPGKPRPSKPRPSKPRPHPHAAPKHGGGAAPKAHAAPKSKPRPPARPKGPTGAGGVPTPLNPTFSLATPGPAPMGVPNFFIDQFRIPPFLLPIYQAAGIQYNIPWQVLAGINEIETDYGRNLSVSTAGAVGWMQFLPSTFKQYGVDANGDGRKDPYNPADAIFSAARYLKAAGGDKDIRKGIFAYNHADWYVQSVLLRAKLIGGLPADLIGSLTGLTQGHFPVAATARYADDLSAKQATRRVKGSNAAVPVDSSARRRTIDIFAARKAPVIAVQDGRIVKMGTSKRLGRYVLLQDAYGNTYTYGHLGSVSRLYPVLKEKKVSAKEVARELSLPKRDKAPAKPATAGRQPARPHAPAPRGSSVRSVSPRPAPAPPAHKERLFANPTRPAAYRAGGDRQVSLSPSVSSFKNYFTQAIGLNRSDVVLKPLKPGSQVIAGTILGRIGQTVPKTAPHIAFEVRPAGRGAPRVDPKPILDGWKLLESTAIYRAAGKNPFFGPDARNPSIGQILLMSKEALQQRVLADPKIDIYACGRRDIEAGTVDRRVLATLEFLVADGLKPSVSSLRCGHSFLAKSGNVSEHSSGDAVDLAKVNGIPIAGHQGPGSITELTIRRLLTLQGTQKPHQIISLMKFPGTDNTLALPDHYDHIHVGFHPLFGENTRLGRQLSAILKPGQWLKLIDRLNAIPNPKVSVKPSRFSIP